jgi:hypothetical protein
MATAKLKRKPLSKLESYKAVTKAANTKEV